MREMILADRRRIKAASCIPVFDKMRAVAGESIPAGGHESCAAQKLVRCVIAMTLELM